MTEPRTFYGLLKKAWNYTESLVCVGLDPTYEELPEHIRREFPLEKVDEAIIAFNQGLIDGTKKYACAYKINPAFYLKYGDKGTRAMRRTIDYIRIHAPYAVIILDGKYGDSRETNEGYAKYAFDECMVDAATINAYMGGEETFLPFLERHDKGVIVLCKSSTTDGATFQDLVCRNNRRLYMNVAHEVRRWNDKYNNCGVVGAATYPLALKSIRKAVGSIPILAPGIGAQGGNIDDTTLAGINSEKTGLLLASSRGIMYASRGTDFPAAAEKEIRRIQRACDRVRKIKLSVKPR